MLDSIKPNPPPDEILAPAESVAKIQSNKPNNNSNNRQWINHLSSPSENKIHNYQKQTGNNSGKIISIGKIPFNHFLTPSSIKSDQRSVAAVINKLTNKNIINSSDDFGLVNTGEITPAVNQAAATVLANSERDFSWTKLNSFINDDDITRQQIVSIET